MTTELEKARHAKIREANGKEPKIEVGERKAITRDNMILGGLVENIMGQINYTEMILGEKMFLDFSAPLRDGRTLQMKLSDIGHQDLLVAQELANAQSNTKGDTNEYTTSENAETK